MPQQPSRSRRFNGEGTVYRHASGYWAGEVTLGWTIEGKRKKKTVYAKTRVETVRKMRQTIRQHQDGLLTTGKPPKLHQWLDYWLTNIAKPSLRPIHLEVLRWPGAPLE